MYFTSLYISLNFNGRSETIQYWYLYSDLMIHRGFLYVLKNFGNYTNLFLLHRRQ